MYGQLQLHLSSKKNQWIYYYNKCFVICNHKKNGDVEEFQRLGFNQWKHGLAIHWLITFSGCDMNAHFSGTWTCIFQETRATSRKRSPESEFWFKLETELLRETGPWSQWAQQAHKPQGVWSCRETSCSSPPPTACMPFIKNTSDLKTDFLITCQDGNYSNVHK